MWIFFSSYFSLDFVHNYSRVCIVIYFLKLVSMHHMLVLSTFIATRTIV